MTKRHKAQLDRDAVVKKLEAAMRDAGGTVAFAKKHAIAPNTASNIIRGTHPIGRRIEGVLKIERCQLWQEK